MRVGEAVKIAPKWDRRCVVHARGFIIKITLPNNSVRRVHHDRLAGPVVKTEGPAHGPCARGRPRREDPQPTQSLVRARERADVAGVETTSSPFTLDARPVNIERISAAVDKTDLRRRVPELAPRHEIGDSDHDTDSSTALNLKDCPPDVYPPPAAAASTTTELPEPHIIPPVSRTRAIVATRRITRRSKKPPPRAAAVQPRVFRPPPARDGERYPSRGRTDTGHYTMNAIATANCGCFTSFFRISMHVG